MPSLAVRTISLIAAYALALQALILALTPSPVLAGPASMTFSVVCTSAGNADQPAGQDHAPCNFDCAMAGCGTAGWVPPSLDVIGIVTPAQLPLQLQRPIQINLRISYKSPQAPRAPPHA